MISTETDHRFLPLSVVLVRCRRLQDLLVIMNRMGYTENWAVTYKVKLMINV